MSGGRLKGPAGRSGSFRLFLANPPARCWRKFRDYNRVAMRFLMLNWRDPENPISGGAERVSLAYLAELARRGHEVYWFANDFSGAKPQSEISGIKIVRGGGKGTSVLKARQWYRSQKKFDLVIDQHHGIPWYAPWWCGT